MYINVKCENIIIMWGGEELLSFLRIIFEHYRINKEKC